MNVSDPRLNLLLVAVRVSLISCLGYMAVKWLVNKIDPTSKEKKDAKLKGVEKMKQLANTSGVSLNSFQLTEHELIIASNVIDPQDINVSYENIAGLENIIQELRETVILPIQKRELFLDSRLTQAPKGILLHGPPGCGKTMIAKATAKECNTRFINLSVSCVTDKMYGESPKLVDAVFSLAEKLQPCIIFIDEIESFLRARNVQDHEATAIIKTQFMCKWDGFLSDPSCIVVVMGATNRPQDLDAAVLRRMPVTFHIGLPNINQRIDVLKLILGMEPIEKGKIDYAKLASMTDGFSGSDLHEMCRKAAMCRVRDFCRNQPDSSTSNSNEDIFHDAFRPITMEDLVSSCNLMKKAKLQTGCLSMAKGIDLD